MPSDALDALLDQQIRAAKQAMVDLASGRPDQAWTAFELKKKARNGWSGSTMGLALYDLLDEGRLEEDADSRLRLKRK